MTGHFPLAAFARKGEAVEGRFDILLDNHLEEVWAALTEPTELVRWLAPGAIEPRVGGRARIDFQDSGILIDSQVTVFNPKRALEYSWSSPGEATRPIRWELEPVGAATRLVLTVNVPKDEDAGRACAGWAAHLEMLIGTLAGVSAAFPMNLFKAARELYDVEVAAL
jgi:uncharacterized protein YndB with AHSA1/START domain